MENTVLNWRSVVKEVHVQNMQKIFAGIVVGVIAYVYFQYVQYPDKGKHNEFPSKLNASYDYIVVGAGSSGSVLASRLTEDLNNDVVLLEAGSSDDVNPNINIPAAASTLQGTDEDWEYYTVPQKHACRAMKEQRSYWPRGKVLGGTGSLNWMVYVRGSRHDYDSWAEEGCDGWSYNDVLPYFMKSEDIQIDEFKNSDYRGKGGPLPVTKTDLTPFQKLYLDAAKELGYRLIDINGEDQLGFSWMQSTIKQGERWSSYRAFVKPHLDRSNLHVIPNAFVTKVIIKDKKAVGVECIKDGRKVRVFARKEVILSAGAINSPQLLMLSGVGPKEHLNTLGIPVLADLPVGDNLQDHFLTPLTVRINTTGTITLDKWSSTWTWMQYLLFRSGPLSATPAESLGFVYKNFDKIKESGQSADIQVEALSEQTKNPSLKDVIKFNYKEEVKDKLFVEPDDTESIVFLSIILNPKSRGTIRLRSRDPFDYPDIDPHYLEDEEDVRMAVQGIRFLEKLVSTNTLQSIGMDVNNWFPAYELCSQHVFRSDEFWECIVRHFTLTAYHPTSTCRMGSKDDPSAVVDPKLRVRGISSLRVVDASVMRNVPAGNTNAPSIMIGEKAADLILQG